MRLAVFLGLLALAPTALAVEVGPARVDVTSTTQFSYHGDNEDDTSCNDNYYDVFEKLNIIGSHGPWTAALRLDGALFLDAPVNDPDGSPPCVGSLELGSSRYPPRWATLEKIAARYNDGDFDVTLGDSYVSFGRGLTLSLRKVDELGVDTTLRGAKAILRHRIVEGTLVAGTPNMGNIDESEGWQADDPWDFASGGRVEVEALDGMRLGGHGVLYAFERTDYDERWFLWGPTFDAPRLLPYLGLYLEGVQQRRTDPEGETATGNGVYGTATVYAGRATVLVEGKAYGDLAVVKPVIVDHRNQEIEAFRPVQYNVPPTAERLLQDLENPQANVRGARARFDWAFAPSLTTYVNYGLFQEQEEIYQDPRLEAGEPGFGDILGGTIHDPYAGGDVRWDQGRSRFTLEAGTRYVFVKRDVTVGRDIHVDANLTQVLPHRFAMELHAQDNERLRALPGFDEKFRKGSLQASLKWRSTVSASFILDFSTEFSRTWYPGGQLDWTFTTPMFATSSKLSLFVGSRRGGLKCVSGVCRVFPAFDGVRLIATIRL